MGTGTAIEIKLETETETEIKKRVDSFRQAVDQKSKETDRLSSNTALQFQFSSVQFSSVRFGSSTIHTLPGK